MFIPTAHAKTLKAMHSKFVWAFVAYTFALITVVVFLHHVGEEQTSANFLWRSDTAAEHIRPEGQSKREVPGNSNAILS